MVLPTNLARWLTGILSSSPPSTEIIAFNIGLFEVEDGFCAYLAGSHTFDEHSNDWAIDPVYKPEAGYFQLPTSVCKFNDWQDCLVNVMSAVSVALTAPSLLASPVARAKAVTVGFDDGDLHRIR